MEVPSGMHVIAQNQSPFLALGLPGEVIHCSPFLGSLYPETLCRLGAAPTAWSLNFLNNPGKTSQEKHQHWKIWPAGSTCSKAAWHHKEN